VIKTDHIRNFSIIAHIDHGKSTLADRLMQLTGTVTARQSKEQLLDSMDLERERGITIKASPVTMIYQHQKRPYMLNLIDTPGHVDFHYEVSRALAACEGALLIVDAAQGVQAQTVANAYLAIDADLEIIPVINKIDLPTAQPDRVADEIENVIGIEKDQCLLISAKSGQGIDQLLDQIIHRLPAPPDHVAQSTAALIFDSHFDDYRGVICYIRLFAGSLRLGQKNQVVPLHPDLYRQRVGQVQAPDQPAKSVMSSPASKNSPTSSLATPSPIMPSPYKTRCPAINPP